MLRDQVEGANKLQLALCLLPINPAFTVLLKYVRLERLVLISQHFKAKLNT